MPSTKSEANAVHDQPVSFIHSDKEASGPQQGVGLCLSGGGYRAMLFHVGSLWRLNEAGLLPRLVRISSVSGGSITAAKLGLSWSQLGFSQSGVAERFEQEVVNPTRSLAGRTIDAAAIIGGTLLPGSIGDKIERAYAKRLFGESTLQDLPDEPRFVLNATNVQSGVLWRFSKPFMADYRVGLVRSPKTALAKAVAASSAFPPLLSPVELELEPNDFEKDSGQDLQEEPYTSEVVLTDGGVYDNLGLETVWKKYTTVLISNAGGAMQAEPDPKRDWGRHAYRVLTIIDNQVRSLRKRQIIAAFKNEKDPHDGAYWGIRTNISNYKLEDALPCPVKQTLDLADTPTRLKRLPAERQERLINWGYAVCDAALRRHFDRKLKPPVGFPYKRGV